MEVPGVLARVPQNYTMCTDGTFAVVPHQFTQMLLVLVTVNERLVPAYTGATYVDQAGPAAPAGTTPPLLVVGCRHSAAALGAVPWWWGVVTVLLP